MLDKHLVIRATTPGGSFRGARRLLACRAADRDLGSNDEIAAGVLARQIRGHQRAVRPIVASFEMPVLASIVAGADHREAGDRDINGTPRIAGLPGRRHAGAQQGCAATGGARSTAPVRPRPPAQGDA